VGEFLMIAMSEKDSQKGRARVNIGAPSMDFSVSGNWQLTLEYTPT
jgi:hypothetical protein